HRVTIRENVDAIRLQKQLSEKSAALLAMQEKYSSLQEMQTRLEEVQGERDLLKESYDKLLERIINKGEGYRVYSSGQKSDPSLCPQLPGRAPARRWTGFTLVDRSLTPLSVPSSLAVPQPGDGQGQQVLRLQLQALQESLRQEEQDRETAEQRAARDRGGRGARRSVRPSPPSPPAHAVPPADTLTSLRETHATLQQEVLRRTEEVTSLQDQLDSVTKEFNMSVEELSETLLQIKMFRLQREGEEKLRFLRKETPGDCGNTEHHQLLDLQATQAETVLELQKTRELLLLQHRITADTQNELQTVMKRAEKEREESRRSLEERDRLLEQRAQRISTLQAQLREVAYSRRPHRQTVPPDCVSAGGGGRVTLGPPEEDAILSWRQEGESLLEVHVAGATFTPVGLRAVGGEAVTFCTYAFRDFETHATPLASGPRPAYGFTSRYPVSRGDLSPQGAAEGGGVRVELHQSLGGVRFVTRGRGVIPLTGALRRGGERVPGTANLTGPDGEILGVLDFWVRLWPPLEGAEGPRDPGYLSYHTLGWPDSGPQELFDFSGGGIPNELEVVMEHCHGLSARWPGLLPDAYLMYRLYDLPPHTSPIIPCCADPVFHDRARFPLAVTPDLCRYLQGACLWVYAFDDGDGPPPPPAYLGKTPIPLRPLAAGRPVRGDFVLRDAGGQPRGTLRVSLRWQYPFQPPGAPPGHRAAAAAGTGGLERAGPEQTPVAKPRVREREREQTQTQVSVRHTHTTHGHSRERGKGGVQRRSLKRGQGVSRPDHSCGVRPTRDRSFPLSWINGPSPYPPPTNVEQEVAEVEQEVAEEAAMEEEAAQEQEVEAEHSGRSQEAGSERAQLDSDVTTESGESQPSTDSDVIIIPRPLMPAKKAEKLRVEILSLTFDPTSRVALDQSVQRIYVEYRLLGVPMETTETPMSLRKPAAGEEIHYNFTRVSVSAPLPNALAPPAAPPTARRPHPLTCARGRPPPRPSRPRRSQVHGPRARLTPRQRSRRSGLIHVDRVQDAALRQYLYTMLEGTDPNQGRLKFTVVSEPMDEQEEECVDVGHAHLDLQEVLLTGSDVVERQIDSKDLLLFTVLSSVSLVSITCTDD
ncbi:FTM protein, partial [Atractosteus spatula]|nr:FTM protein [Atractosteus spatula]